MFSPTPYWPRGLALARKTLIGTCLVGAFALEAFGGVDPEDLSVSPDTTIKYAGEILTDEAASVSGAPSMRVDFGPLPQGVEVTGFHVEGNEVFFAVDQSIILHGTVITPQDVAITNGNQSELFFKGAGEGVPRSAKIDAVALDGNDLFLSFDTALILSGEIIADEDLVAMSGSSPAVIFDGSAEGIPPGVDLDAAHFLDGSTLALSFDSSAKIGGILIDDEDVLAWDGAFFLIYDGSAVESHWQAADLNGVSIGAAPPVDVLFEDDFESGDVSAWTLNVP